MEEVEAKVQADTDGLLLVRSQIVAAVVLLGTVGGSASDLILGRLLDFPYRRMAEMSGLVAMSLAIYAARRNPPVGSPRRVAMGTTVLASLFLFVVFADAGPEARTVIVLSYTVLNLGAATLLPWGIWSQLGFVGVVLVSIQASLMLYVGGALMDRGVYVSLSAGVGLSLFLASYLERGRLALARQRYELAEQKELAEQQREAADRQRARVEAFARDLDAYAHTVAHDLKNPISVIAGYADLLETNLADRTDEQQRGVLQRITSGCEKMTQIINELLLLANVRRRAEVPREALEMGGIVDEVRQRVSTLVERSRAELIVPRDWPQAVGYAPWVEEVWANYVSNAIKYGGSPPRIVLGADRPGDGAVRFWVRDNGPGFDPGRAGQLFEEFSPVASVGAGGHGLGLSIVKRIVERLGGEVSVTSAPGEGSTFGFTLPTADRCRPSPHRSMSAG